MGLHHAATTQVSISIDPVAKRISVASPFNHDFTNGARQIGGRWDGTSRRWTFPRENEGHVHALCMSVYGTLDGIPKPTREALEKRLADHFAAIVDIQAQLDALDAKEGNA